MPRLIVFSFGHFRHEMRVRARRERSGITQHIIVPVKKRRTNKILSMDHQRHNQATPPSTPLSVVVAATAPTANEDHPQSSPLELPLTPQSNNRGTTISVAEWAAEDERGSEGGDDPPSPMMLAGGGVGVGVGVCEQDQVVTRFARNLSALSTSSNEDEHAQRLLRQRQAEAEPPLARNLLPLSSNVSSFYEEDHVQQRLRRHQLWLWQSS